MQRRMDGIFTGEGDMIKVYCLLETVYFSL